MHECRQRRVLVSAGAATVLVLAVASSQGRLLAAQADALRIGEQKFEVASVKTNKSGDGPTQIALQPGGRLTIENMSLRALIRFAFQVQDAQLVGGPEWFDREHFDVLAKAEHDFQPAPPGTTGPGQLMLRSLLADRFKLAIHSEQRELQVYALTPARTDGRLGPQLKRSTVDCQAAAGRGRGASPAATGQPPCSMRVAPGAMFLSGFPLSQLATALSNFVRRTVVDRTGLEGSFDVELHWTPDQMPQGTPPAGAAPASPSDPNGPSIFTAVQEQLGLKLEASRVPQDVLVIDHVELPTPD